MPLSLSEVFTESGFETEHAKTSGLRGATDKEIAKYALKQKKILVTKDLEFGSLLLYPPGSHYGLIVIRVPFNFKKATILPEKEILPMIKPAIIVKIAVLSPRLL